MSILLKQSYFSAFTRSKPMFRVLPQQSYGTLVWRGVLGLHLGNAKLFLGNQPGLSYKLSKSNLGANRDRAQLGGNFVSGANLLH